MNCLRVFVGLVLLLCSWPSVPMIVGQELPASDAVKPVNLFEVASYCEGVVFDHGGRGYISWGKTITQFRVDGQNQTFAVTGAPNGHKILADGTHLVCDASQHAVLRLDAAGVPLAAASTQCNGVALRGPNDLTLDPAGGFYFTDPGESGKDNPIGTIHFVDAAGITHLVASGLAFPNGIVLTQDGQRLLVGESQLNRVLEYPVIAPGKVGPMRVFAQLPTSASGKWEDNQPDGMCLDAQGNLYVAHYGMKQVQVLDPAGKLIRQYDGGNQLTSNVAFGGPNHDQLFVTGSIGADGKPGAVFRLDVGVQGRVILPPKK
ncbi:MAG: SMP-30/gluconolactonase/LRE family protein [Pirellulaceae bacterium]|nr:SMP-30/gluconolactonase/LRE family protein [Pirellulaceae bacterium]